MWGTKLAPAHPCLVSYSVNRQKEQGSATTGAPGAGWCTTGASRSKIMATWNATGKSIYKWYFFDCKHNPIQVKKHFTCSRLQCLTTFYLFKTASASHGGIKRKASSGTLVLILSEAARILFWSVIIGNISNPFTARFLKMPCIIKYLPSMATTSDTEGEQCSQISVPEQGVTGRHSSLNLLFEKSE